MAFLTQNLPFLDFSALPILIQSAVSTGFTTNATNRDEESTIISVIGRYLKNSPIKLGQNINGTNAATVVAVDAIIAVATSPVPSLDASSLDLPFSENCRYTFSTITIPLSTNIPNASINENNTIIFKLVPL